SQELCDKSSDGGQTWSGETPTTANQEQCVRLPGQAAGAPTAGLPNPCVIPTHVVNKEDSYDTAQHGNDGTPFPDYPLNVQGRITLTDHQFRVNSAGTIAIGHPAGGSASQYRIYSVWSDNCDVVLPGPGQSHDNQGS